MSDEKIDHAAEAGKFIDQNLWREAGALDEHIPSLIARAQVHAALALVEQQRIANLIALNGMASELGYATGAELGDEVAGLLADADIRRGLGL